MVLLESDGIFDTFTAIAVTNALVSNQLDYCNSLLNSISEYVIKGLNLIQYSLWRIIQRTCKKNIKEKFVN